MNLPITLNDSIPQQAGPGAGADELWKQRHERVVEWAHDVFNNKLHPINMAHMVHAMYHLAAPLAVEDSRERCASSDAAPSGLKLLGLYETRDGRRVLLSAKSDDGSMFYGRLPDGRLVGWKADGSTPPDSTGRKEYPSDIVWEVGLIPVGRAAMAAASSGKEN